LPQAPTAPGAQLLWPRLDSARQNYQREQHDLRSSVLEYDGLQVELADHPLHVVAGGSLLLDHRRAGCRVHCLLCVRERRQRCDAVQANLRKLTRPRPTTAPIGTLRVMAALRELAAAHGRRIRVWKLLARSQAALVVSRSDGAATVAAQWAALLHTLATRDSALIFHLHNHYSLIYALREWRARGPVHGGVQGDGMPDDGMQGDGMQGDGMPDDGMQGDGMQGQEAQRSVSAGAQGDSVPDDEAQCNDTRADGGMQWGSVRDGVDGVGAGWVRQVLVGKPGQRPNRWIAWEDVRECLLGWKGYAIIAVQHPVGASGLAADDAGQGARDGGGSCGDCSDDGGESADDEEYTDDGGESADDREHADDAGKCTDDEKYTDDGELAPGIALLPALARGCA
jgi:hypothetical protein